MDELWEASVRLDTGRGTVWAGDHRDGEHHSGRHVRWIRNRGEAELAADYFRTRCDRVRVTAFIDGVPCSIHTIVTGQGSAVLRPVAQRINRDESAGTFTYDSCDLEWRPPASVSASMRSAARRVADSLNAMCNYLGVFTLDGIASNLDFAPTEVNTRFGAGLTQLSRLAPEFGLRVLHAFIADGDPTDWRPDDLEDLLLARFS
jgi:hypothetical protein